MQSEDTHWGEWLATAFRYVGREFPRPWDTRAEQLVAFLFGVISHQVKHLGCRGQCKWC